MESLIADILGICPPKYADLGKPVKELFKKNFNYGNIKFNLKSKSSFGSQLNIEGTSEVESGKANGFAEFKNNFTENDMSIATKWVSDNSIETEIALANRLHRGTKFALITKFDPKGGKFGGACQVEYKNDFVFSNLNLEASGWIAGTQFLFDPSSRKVEKPCFTVGYEASGYSVFTVLTEKNELLASLYQKGGGDSESGIMVQVPYGANHQASFEYAMGASLDSSTKMQIKVNTKCQMGVALIKSFGSGISLSASGNLDGKNIKQGAHKIGLGLEMEI
ncbi:Voltage-dependent anion-selective channel protein 2 [Blomia tropicalis]|nr:Voltage-dependent anion-selective channel protein 2 [Blomia tropicalis]